MSYRSLGSGDFPAKIRSKREKPGTTGVGENEENGHASSFFKKTENSHPSIFAQKKSVLAVPAKPAKAAIPPSSLKDESCCSGGGGNARRGKRERSYVSRASSEISCFCQTLLFLNLEKGYKRVDAFPSFRPGLGFARNYSSCVDRAL